MDPCAESFSAFADESLERDERAYYTQRWLRFENGTGALGFNWPACLFGSNWCLWRKQYALAVGVWLGEAACGFMLGFGYVLGRGPADPSDPVLGFLVYLALPIVRIPLGKAANRLYLDRARSAIAAASSLPTPSERTLQVRKRGGTSPLALAAGVVLSVAAMAWARLQAG